MYGCDLCVTPRVLGWEEETFGLGPSLLRQWLWDLGVALFLRRISASCFLAGFPLSGGSRVSSERSCCLARLQFPVVVSPDVMAQGHLAGGPHASQSSVPSLLQDDVRSALVSGWGSLLSAVTIQRPPGNGACSVGQPVALGLPGHPHLSHTYY